MRFLYINVLQMLNQMVDLMLRIMGHVPTSHVCPTWPVCSLNFGGQCNWCPQRKLLGDVSPLSPAGFTPLV